MTNFNEHLLASLKVVRDEMGKTAEVLQLQIDLGITDHGEAATKDALENFFLLQVQLMNEYIKAAEDAIKGQS